MKDGKSIVLIGMPGVGKSTIGVILAKEIGYQFLDADLLIQEQEGMLLKDIIATKGHDGFLAVENQVTAKSMQSILSSLQVEVQYIVKKQCFITKIPAR